MIKTLEKSGRTAEDAVAAALEELGLERDDVSVEIIERAKSGFLGIGATPAVVRVSYEAPDEPEEVPVKTEAPKKKEKSAPKKKEKAAEAPAEPAAAKQEEAAGTEALEIQNGSSNPDAVRVIEFLTGLFEKMNVQAGLKLSDSEDNGIDVIVYGPAMGSIIGRRGETLDAIQHLVNYSVNRGGEKHVHVSLDAENYRAKREESLVRLANKMAAKVLKYRRSMALEPMNSYERHVIHTALQDFEGVTTASTGTEPNRRVVISCERGENRSSSRGGNRRGGERRNSRPAEEKAPETAAPAEETAAEETVTEAPRSKKPESREWA